MALKKLWVPTFFLPTLSGILFWDQDDVEDMFDDVPVAPNIWTDGGREDIPHLDVEVAGAVLLFTLQLSSLTVIIGAMLRILMIHMRVALTSSLVFLGPIQ